MERKHDLARTSCCSCFPLVFLHFHLGDVFGELALLYNTTRAANVDAREDSVLWKLDRRSFNSIVKDAAQKKRERYEGFLGSVGTCGTFFVSNGPPLQYQNHYIKLILHDQSPLGPVVENDGQLRALAVVRRVDDLFPSRRQHHYQAGRLRRYLLHPGVRRCHRYQVWLGP